MVGLVFVVDISFLVCILELAATARIAQRRRQSVQINQRFWRKLTKADDHLHSDKTKPTF